MTMTGGSQDRVEEIGQNLPYLRRYARALTGNQDSGDAYAAATLEAIIEDDSSFPEGDVRVGLFHAFHSIWSTTGAPVATSESGLKADAQRHLAKLTANSREALLLYSIEEFTSDQIATIMDVERSEADHLIGLARQEMEDAIAGRVLIIEDEAIIAADLEDIVSEMGHRIVGVARTRDSAVELGRKDTPDLIMTDIQLADNSSGIDAVNDLLALHPDTPVIFITAFPERLLTGEKPEPAFLIAKPYSEDQVRSAVSQAMFFSSTQTLTA